jgi:hypothetical protein
LDSIYIKEGRVRSILGLVSQHVFFLCPNGSGSDIVSAVTMLILELEEQTGKLKL